MLSFENHATSTLEVDSPIDFAIKVLSVCKSSNIPFLAQACTMLADGMSRFKKQEDVDKRFRGVMTSFRELAPILHQLYKNQDQLELHNSDREMFLGDIMSVIKAVDELFLKWDSYGLKRLFKAGLYEERLEKHERKLKRLMKNLQTQLLVEIDQDVKKGNKKNDENFEKVFVKLNNLKLNDQAAKKESHKDDGLGCPAILQNGPYAGCRCGNPIDRPNRYLGPGLQTCGRHMYFKRDRCVFTGSSE